MSNKITGQSLTGKNLPIIHKEFDKLGGRIKQCRIRVLQFQHPEIGVSQPMLDLRQFLDGKVTTDGRKFTGFTSHAVSFNLDNVKKLRKILDEVIPYMEQLSNTPESKDSLVLRIPVSMEQLSNTPKSEE